MQTPTGTNYEEEIAKKRHCANVMRSCYQTFCRYFAAIAEKNVEKVRSHLHREVLVTFNDDPKRNWKGNDNVEAKFRDVWWKKYPGIHKKAESVTNFHLSEGKARMEVFVFLEDQGQQHFSMCKMMYTMEEKLENPLILRIDHL